MKRILSIYILTCLIGCCCTKNELYKARELKDFNLSAAYSFVKQIDSVNPINNISLVDIKKDGKQFKVNKQHIFIDTSYTDQPNFYSYKKRAKEINVPERELIEVLNKFYKIGVNEFQRTEKYYIFKVEKYLNTQENGYLYNNVFNLNPGDTISYIINAVERNLKIERQVDKNWFEYIGINYR